MGRIESVAVVTVTLAGVLSCGENRPVAAGKVTLRYHPPAGASYRYVLEQEDTTKVLGGPVAGDETGITHVYFTDSIGGTTPAGIGVRVRLDSMEIVSPMLSGTSQPLLTRARGLTATIVYDDRINALHTELGSTPNVPALLTDQLQRNILALVFPLPAGPVGVGDSWSADLELPLGVPTSGGDVPKAHTTLTVKEMHTDGADSTVLLGIAIAFPDAPIKVTQQGQDLTLRLSGGLTGEQLFSLTKGTAERLSLHGTKEVDVRGIPGGPGMHVSTRQTTALSLSAGK